MKSSRRYRTAGCAVVALAAVHAGVAHAAGTAATCAGIAERTQDLRASGRLVEARAALLECAAPSCPDLVRRDCIAWLADVDANLPSLVVRARDAQGRDLIDVRVVVDGHVVREKLDGTAFTIDPGAHHVRFEARGRVPVDQDLLAQQGEKNRIVTVQLAEASAPAPPPPPMPAPAPALAVSPTPGDRAPTPAATYVAGGIGVAALAAFAVVEIIAQRDYRDLENGCAPTHSCSASSVDATRTKFVLAGAALGVGVVGLTIAAWTYLARPTRRPSGRSSL